MKITDFYDYNKPGRKISLVTAYDYTLAALAAESAVDCVLVGDVLYGGAGHPDAAMEARQQALVGQTLHITPHGLQGDAQGLGQLLHRDGALCLDDREQSQLSGVWGHCVFVP